MMDKLMAALIWPIQQLWGGLKRFWQWLVVEFSLSDVVYPWLVKQGPRAIGGGSPGEQITGSIVLMVITVASTFWSVFGMVALLIILGAFFAIGFLRFIPAVDDAWAAYWPFYPWNYEGG